MMPLRDHFHPPLGKVAKWTSLHAGWPMVMVQTLAPILPIRFRTDLRVNSGALFEIDVGALEKGINGATRTASVTNGETAVWAPSLPTLVIETDLPSQDEFEVRVYDEETGHRLVAVVEIVSPANKDRPEHRTAFVAKCAALLQEQVSVTIVDPVTSRDFNLYEELLDLLGKSDPVLDREASPIYAVTCRGLQSRQSWCLENWYHVLHVGQPLPVLPLWLTEDFSLPLDLETSYEKTCHDLRIP